MLIMKKTFKRLCALFTGLSLLVPTASVWADDVKFPQLPNSTDFSEAETIGDVFSSVSKDDNWRSTYGITDGVYGKDPEDKCVKIGFAGDGQKFYSLNTTFYLSNPSNPVLTSDKLVNISFSAAVDTNKITKAGLMVGHGLGQWVSTISSTASTNPDAVGIIGLSGDGIYAFGEKLMDYETEKWYDFRAVLYGGTNKYDVYVNEKLVKSKGEVNVKFTDVARTALVGYRHQVPTADGTIGIYFDNVSMSIDDVKKFSGIGSSTDFSMLQTEVVGDKVSVNELDDVKTSDLSTVDVYCDSRVYGKEADDNSLLIRTHNASGDLPAYFTANLTPDDSEAIDAEKIKISFSVAVSAFGADKSGIIIAADGESGASNLESEESAYDAEGFVGISNDKIFAFGEELGDCLSNEWNNFEVVIYGGTPYYEIYNNGEALKDDGIFKEDANLIDECLLIAKNSTENDVNIYFDDISIERSDADGVLTKHAVKLIELLNGAQTQQEFVNLLAKDSSMYALGVGIDEDIDSEAVAVCVYENKSEDFTMDTLIDSIWECVFLKLVLNSKPEKAVAEYGDKVGIDSEAFSELDDDIKNQILILLVDNIEDCEDIPSMYADCLVLASVIGAGGSDKIKEVVTDNGLVDTDYEYYTYISKAEQNFVFSIMYDSRAHFKNFDDIKKCFEEASKTVYDKYNKPSSSGGSGGGGGGGTKVISVPKNTVLPTVDPQDEKTDIATDKEEITFSDISDSYAKESITELCKNGILNGFEDGTFKPESLVTRAEFSKMIYLAFGYDEASYQGFNDVDENCWYAKYVLALANKNIILGYNGFFMPNDNISRQDAAVIMSRVLNLQSKDGELLYADSDIISDYAKSAVIEMTQHKIMQGDGTLFAPLDKLTREETAVIIHRAYNIK